MKKILLLIDALNFKTETLNFAAYIASQGASKLVGVFIEPQELQASPTIKSIGGHLYVEEITQSVEERKEEDTLIQKNIHLYKEACLQREVCASIHQYKKDTLKNIVHETRYADLVIVDPALSLTSDKNIPSKLATEILANAECPVLIAPEYFEQIDEVIFAFDGSKGAAFAIKQFYYQLHELADKKITIVHINEGAINGRQAIQKSNFKEWLDMHFANISFLELSGNPSDLLFKYFLENNADNNKLLVMGAFGRSVLSSFFKPSTANLIMKAVDIPIFITHY